MKLPEMADGLIKELLEERVITNEIAGELRNLSAEDVIKYFITNIIESGIISYDEAVCSISMAKSVPEFRDEIRRSWEYKKQSSL